MSKYFYTAFICLLGVKSFSQNSTNQPVNLPKNNLHHKGEFFIQFGYNRSTYAKSDIRFIGTGYDFTLKNIVAKDKPTPFDLSYFSPEHISAPQFNLRFGWFLNKKWSLSFGWDHMKYVMVRNQLSTISGHISAQVSEPAIATGKYAGDYTGQEFLVTPDFLTFQHTNGYNYVGIELDHYCTVWEGKNQHKSLEIVTGVGVGPLVTRSDVRLFEVGKSNFWHTSGYGASAKVGVRYNFAKHFFLQLDAKGGTSHLGDIMTTGRETDRAKQNISFLEGYGTIGYKVGRK